MADIGFERRLETGVLRIEEQLDGDMGFTCSVADLNTHYFSNLKYSTAPDPSGEVIYQSARPGMALALLGEQRSYYPVLLFAMLHV